MIKERRRCGACEVLSGGTGYIDTACVACGYESCLAHVEGHRCKTAEQPATAAQPAELPPCKCRPGMDVCYRCFQPGDHFGSAQPADAKRPNTSGWCNTCLSSGTYTASCEHVHALRAKVAAKPAVQPKRPHDFSDPYVRDSSKRIVCVSCGFPPGWSAACDARDWRARYEANINTDGVTNVLSTASIPERIDRRLSHVGGMHDEDLVGR